MHKTARGGRPRAERRKGRGLLRASFESFENFFENSFIGFLVKIGNAVIVA
jgi:hypothetical protein